MKKKFDKQTIVKRETSTRVSTRTGAFINIPRTVKNNDPIAEKEGKKN